MTWEDYYNLPVAERMIVSAGYRERCVSQATERRAARMRHPWGPARDRLAMRLHNATEYEFSEEKPTWEQLTDWDRDEYRVMIDHILADRDDVLAAVLPDADQDSPTTTR